MRRIIIITILLNFHFGLLAQEPTLKVFPNPFIDTTWIVFTLPANDTVSLVIYDQFGVLIDSLVKEQLMPAGSQSIQFVGDSLPIGQYFAFLDVDTHLVSKKLVKVQCAMSAISWINPIWCLPCNGEVVTAAIGTLPFSYSWSTGDSTSSIDSLCTGTFIVTVTDSTGCTAIDSITFTPEPDMTVSITTTPASCSTCADGCMTITPSGGCLPYTIATIPPDPFFSPCQVTPGTYVIEVCDDCGCCIQDTVIIDSGSVGLAEVKLQDIVIYPNPTNGQVTVTSLSEEATTVTIYGVRGELVYNQRLTGSNYHVIDLTRFPSGLYYMQVFQRTSILKKMIINE